MRSKHTLLLLILQCLLFNASRCDFLDNEDMDYLNSRDEIALQPAGMTDDKFDNDNLMAQKYDKENLVSSGVCHVEAAVSNISQLIGCKEITSDLLIENAIGEWDSKELIVVEGCITVRNTELFDVNFLLGLKKVTCYLGNGGNAIYSNTAMCIEEDVQGELNRFFQRVESSHGHCPTCTGHYRYNSKCKTFIGDLTINSTFTKKDTELKFGDLVEVVGSVIIFKIHKAPPEGSTETYAKIASTSHLLINCPSCDEAPLKIYSSDIPPEGFFANLSMVIGNSRVSIEFRDVKNYAMKRGLYSALTDRFQREVDVEYEQEGECYLSNDGDNMYEGEDMMMCEVLKGHIVFNSLGVTNLHRCQWKVLNTSEREIKIKGGYELMNLFAHRPTVEFQDDIFNFKLIFENKICLNAQVLQAARQWMVRGRNKEHMNRVDYEIADDCTTYVGNLTAYDLRNDKGNRLQNIRGTLTLEALVINSVLVRVKREMGSNKQEVFDELDISRFHQLKNISKPWNYPKDMPALNIHMCSNEVQVPEWLSKVEVRSDREDDVLIKVAGPGFKMDPTLYNTLVGKYGAHRLDIHPLLPGECYFSGKIEDLSVLDNCESIIGDLVIEGVTTGTTEALIKQVTGCIRILNTTLDDLDFLRFEIPYDMTTCKECSNNNKKFEIAYNENLCTSHKLFNVEKNFVHHNHVDCGSGLPSGQVIEENVIISGYSNESDLADRHLEDVREIYGRLIITRNSFEKLTIFRNLRLIKHLGPGPALLLENNQNLTTFTLPQISIIIGHEEEVVVFRDNPKLDKETEAIKDEYVKVIRKGKVLVEHTSESDNYFVIGLVIGFTVLIGMAILAIGITIAAITISKTIKKKVAARNANKKKNKEKRAKKDSKEKSDEGEPHLDAGGRTPVESQVTIQEDDPVNKALSDNMGNENIHGVP